MKESTKQWFRDSFQKPIAILLVDDSPYLDVTVKFLRILFPKAWIRVLSEEEYQAIDEFIEQYDFDLAFIDGSLRKWKAHPIYRTDGSSVVRMVKKKKPNTLVISMSTNPTLNKIALECDADDELSKLDFHLLKKL